jgi:hypothetical protein
MREDGIATASFHELFPHDVWTDVQEDIRDFARETEARLDEYRRRTDGKTFIVRRFVAKNTGAAKAKRAKFALSNPWLRLGLSAQILDVVNAYRGELTYLIDLDNWYTIPDAQARERIESQQWHRDPWNDHVVKVFVYFSDVDEEAGPFEYVRGSPAGGRYGELWPWVPKGIYPPPKELEARVQPEDRLTVTGSTGTVIFCDTSGFHRGGAAKTKPRILSYHTYVSPPPGKSPRFKVDWSSDEKELSAQARFALAWSLDRE